MWNFLASLQLVTVATAGTRDINKEFLAVSRQKHKNVTCEQQFIQNTSIIVGIATF